MSSTLRLSIIMVFLLATTALGLFAYNMNLPKVQVPVVEVTVKAPEGISFEVPQPTQIIVSGSSKQQVGEVAARIRKWRPPEPYKGKGVRYAGEVVVRKVGKRA